jgi:hypothetical protein
MNIILKIYEETIAIYFENLRWLWHVAPFLSEPPHLPSFLQCKYSPPKRHGADERKRMRDSAAQPLGAKRNPHRVPMGGAFQPLFGTIAPTAAQTSSPTPRDPASVP